MTVMAATAWRSNAELIDDVFTLGYLSETDVILDPTYHKGTWWKLRPGADVVSFSNEETSDAYHPGWDFTDMPFADGMFDAVTFDPPYVAKGGRLTSTILAMDDSYGLTDAARTPAELQDVIYLGLAECIRVTKPGGIILVKCKDYISSGHMWEGVTLTRNFAVSHGCEVVDRLEHLSAKGGPQPKGRRQVHARRNLSTLLVLRTCKTRANGAVIP